jgi:hypothetical protein
MLRWFAEGHAVMLSDEGSFESHVAELRKVPGLLALAAERAREPGERALLAELVLEGLHQHLKLAREDLDSGIRFKEMIKFQLLRPPRSTRRRGEDA